MHRRRFLERTATTVGTGVTLAGCSMDDEPENATKTEPTGNESETEPKTEPEPKGGDGRPYTHYSLDVRNEREAGQPVWVDQDGRLYGRDGPEVVVSDDWWKTTETLYSFEGDPKLGDERVETVIVPDSGRILVGIGGHFDETTGRLELLNEDLSGSETLYEFDWGRTSNSMGHAVHENIVVISCYEGSDFKNGNHANEVLISTDGGKSFELVLEPEVVDMDAANNHIHDVEYDPYAERVWVAVGDHGNSQIYWSNDHGSSWKELTERGGVTMITQIAAFKDCVAFGTDGAPEGIIRWEREGPDDEPDGAGDLVRPHVQIKTNPNDDTMEMYARRRWHIREDVESGRELCLMPFGYSPMHDTAEDSVVLASVDGDEWYELYRTETREILLTNVMGPLSMDGDRRTLISDSNQGAGYQVDATVPKFWD
ncbi:beta propeller repeat protein [Halocatena pleomorpha]|uniref:Glycosyl hydrolase n=1 Tax=Halocatena pleomorpha TaxID=1785090 RepID=A0A3P3RDA4_9EURY|nr:glycosyl hydrolase [Halocatena pleomorpha]RRJ31395.1 glycosyl hydrolase [Halocatena pleomorpha]